ncbi:hypothetical protein Tcan_11280, partial [Toxocara canis]
AKAVERILLRSPGRHYATPTDERPFFRMCLLGGMDRSGRVVQPYQGMDKVTAQSTTGNEHRHRATWVLAFVWGTTRLTPSIYVATWDDLCWRMTVSGAFGSTPRRYIKLPSSKRSGAELNDPLTVVRQHRSSYAPTYMEGASRIVPRTNAKTHMAV